MNQQWSFSPGVEFFPSIFLVFTLEFGLLYITVVTFSVSVLLGVVVAFVLLYVSFLVISSGKKSWKVKPTTLLLITRIMICLQNNSGFHMAPPSSHKCWRWTSSSPQEACAGIHTYGSVCVCAHAPFFSACCEGLWCWTTMSYEPDPNSECTHSVSVNMMLICVWNSAIFGRFSFYVKITAESRSHVFLLFV